MKEWNKPVIEELEFKCTESGGLVTRYVDDVRTDEINPDKLWHSFSGK